MNRGWKSAALTGIGSGILFIVSFGLNLGFLFLFFPVFPLLIIGLKQGSLACFQAGVIGSLVALAAGLLPGFLLYSSLLAIPAFLLTRESRLWRPKPSDSGHEWFSLGLAVTHMTLYGAAIITAIIVYYSQETGDIASVMSSNIREAFEPLTENYGEAIALFADRLSFLVFSITLWLWICSIYAHGWLAHMALKPSLPELRPHFVIEPFEMPGWMLGALLLSAFAVMFGSPTLAYIGKTLFFGLLLPYFLLGAALMHRASTAWPGRGFILFFIYFMIFAQFWPALILAALGFWHQCTGLNKRLPESGN